MFCFPNTGQVIILEGTASFKFRLVHLHIYAQFMKRQWVKFPLGKQNIQAKEVFWATLGGGVNVMGHPFLCYFEKVNTLEIVGKIF